jgi:outer membrane protein assembly factor BamB
VCLLAQACGSQAQVANPARAAQAQVASPAPQALPQSIPAPRTSHARLLDWTEFGLDPQRSDSSGLSTGIDAANVGDLRRTTIRLPGTVDSSPVYVHGARVAGSVRDVIVVETTYGRTLAIDASTGRTLWAFTPHGYASWAGTAQITVSTPLIDPDRESVYTTSPNGLLHKLSLATGSEQRAGSWPVSVTRDPTHEKLGAALNIDGPDLVLATSGYYGDAPPYQGHVVLIDRASGRIRAIFNTLCANRRAIIQPSTCPASDSAILSRGGAVVEPGGGRLLIDTGNGPWNGTDDFGDSVLELTVPALRLRQAFTPTDEAYLNSNDVDLGSSAPVLLGEDRVLVAGKDGIMRVLALSGLDGHPPSGHHTLGGEAQTLPLPGGGQLFSAPAVWRAGGHTAVFVGAESATAAYTLRAGRLRKVWQNATPGSSPVLAGGLLYVYDPAGGGVYVYRPSSPAPIARLPGSPGHWNSPIVVDGHVIEPEGDANDHLLSGTLDLFSVR